MPLRLNTFSGFGASGPYPITPPSGAILDGKTAPLMAYSTRLLFSDWGSAVIRLRRGSDNAEDDFFGDLDGNLANAGSDDPDTWASSSTLYIRTWYDQSGNGWDMNQSSAGNQPRLEVPGANNFSQGYAMRNIINNTVLNAGNVTGISGAAGLTVLMMLSNVTLDILNSHISKHAGGTDGSFHIGSDTGGAGRFDCLVITSGRVDLETSYSITVNEPHMTELVYNGTTIQGYINTVDYGSVAQTGNIKTVSGDLLLAGLDGFQAYRTNAHYAETILWASALGDTEREEIRDAMTAFWDA